MERMSSVWTIRRSATDAKLAGWLLIPVEGSDKAPIDDLLGESVRRWPREVWITLVVIASLAITTISGWLSPFTIGPAIVIAVIWYFGKGRHHKESAAEPPLSTDSAPRSAIPEFSQDPDPATPFTEAAQAGQRRTFEHTGQAA